MAFDFAALDLLEICEFVFKKIGKVSLHFNLLTHFSISMEHFLVLVDRGLYFFRFQPPFIFVGCINKFSKHCEELSCGEF